MSCCVKHCRNIRRLMPPEAEISFHRVPKAEFIRYMTQLGHESRTYTVKYICSEHFKKEELVSRNNKTFLAKGAVPTIKLTIETIVNADVRRTLNALEPNFPTDVPPPAEKSIHQLPLDFDKDVSCSHGEQTTSNTSKLSSNSRKCNSIETLRFIPEIQSTFDKDDARTQEDMYSLFDKGLKVEVSEIDVDDHEMPDVKIPVLEKPYFTTVKSYLKDKNRFTDVCRICFRSITNGDVDLLSNNSSEFRNKLKLILPDLDLEIYSNPAFCKKCVQIVENSYELRQKWLFTEEKLQKIIEKKKTSNSTDDLVIMMRSTEDDEMESQTNTVSVKVENIEENPKLPEKIWGSGPFICDTCGDVLSELRLFKRHLIKHKQQESDSEQNQQTICEICGELFNSVIEYNQHSVKHVELRNQCRVCRKRFENRRRLNIHIKYSHMKTRRNLQHDRKLLKKKKENRRKYYLCHICNKQFLFTWYLEQHLRVHFDKLECGHCGKFIKFGNSSMISQQSRTICL